MVPITRSEQYLAAIIGEDVELPVPQSRIEHYLNAIAQNGIEPSSAGLISYDPEAPYPEGSLGAMITSMLDELDDKANIDGYYESMTVGNAEQLVATVGVEDKVPYLFRTSGGSADIGDRETDMLVGGTIAWNQLVNTTDTSVTVPSGHKCYAVISGVRGIGTSAGEGISVTGGTDIVIDLTQMFGSAIADYINTLETTTPGAGVAWFRKLFPKDYYAYDAGTLMSVKTSSHKTVGFNAWDEEWELGTIDSTTGADVSGTTTIRSKNYIPVVPGMQYYAKNASITTASYFNVRFYDADKNYIGALGSGGVQPYWNNSGAHPVIPPDNARYMRFYVQSGYGTTYKNDICINLSWDGERDGEYEAYSAHTYPLDSDLELRGIPKLDADNKLYYDGDTYESDGTVTRKYGIVDLGTLTWTKDSNASRFYTRSINNSVKLATRNALCGRYFVYGTYNEVVGGSGKFYISDQGALSCSDDGSYETGAAFATAMSGVYLVYELATPTTESADPYQNPQIVDDFGTEEYVDPRTVPIPVGHVTRYQANLRAKLEMAPDSPDGNGDYILRQTNGANAYVPLVFPLDELPEAPSSDGTFVLKCTVSGGTVAYSWEAQT